MQVVEQVENRCAAGQLGWQGIGTVAQANRAEKGAGAVE